MNQNKILLAIRYTDEGQEPQNHRWMTLPFGEESGLASISFLPSGGQRIWILLPWSITWKLSLHTAGLFSENNYPLPSGLPAPEICPDLFWTLEAIFIYKQIKLCFHQMMLIFPREWIMISYIGTNYHLLITLLYNLCDLLRMYWRIPHLHSCPIMCK